MKRYRSFSDGERIASLHGDWVRYEEVEEVAERLEKLRDVFAPHSSTDALTAYNELTSIINEIRGKE